MKTENKILKKKAVAFTPKNLSRMISPLEIERYLQLAYDSDRFWGEYQTLFFDLFTGKESAQIKAKTYSVKQMCLQIRNKRGCSFMQIYLVLKRLVASSCIDLEEDQIDLGNKVDFIDSLYR